MDAVNLLKLLRFVHILEIFEPFKRLIDFLMPETIQKQKDNILQLIILFASALLGAHLCACFWIFCGTYFEEGWYNSFVASDPDCVMNPNEECWRLN